METESQISISYTREPKDDSPACVKLGTMIPRTIHYCWFGGNEKSELIKHCLNSWQTHLSDFLFVEWNESNFDVTSLTYTAEAYKQKKYAFVSDVVRAFALAELGGVYLDTDVEIKSNLDFFLQHRAFSGFEEVNSPFTAVWGSEQGHTWPKKVFESYAKIDFDGNNLITNTATVSELLSLDYGIDRSKDELQFGLEGVVIYPSTTFCLDLPLNVASHHFGGSWLGDERQGAWKYHINLKWRRAEFLSYQRDEDLGESLQKLLGAVGIKRATRALFPYVVKKILKTLGFEKNENDP